MANCVASEVILVSVESNFRLCEIYHNDLFVIIVLTALLSNEGGTWQWSQSSKGTTVTKKEDKKSSSNNKKALTQKKQDMTYTKCFGTLTTTVSVFRGIEEINFKHGGKCNNC